MARKSIYPPSVTPGIPKLGENPGGWIETTFGDVLQVVVRKADMCDTTEYQLVTAKRNRGGIVPRSKLLGKDIRTKTQFFIKSGDFLISKRQIIHGACGVVPPEMDGALVSNEYATLRVKDGLLLEYLNYLTHTVYFQQACFQSSVGVDVEKMIFNLKDWLRYEVYLPSIPEQCKIVEILGTWDGAIALTEQLIAAKQKRKKALMQQLLMGRQRFMEFAGQTWKKVQIGSVCTTFSGGTPSRSKPQYYGGKIPWIKSGEINQINILSTEEHITENGLKNSSAKIVEKGTVLLALYGATAGKVGITHIDAALNQALLALIPKTGDLDKDFLFYELQSQMPTILKKLQGGQPNLSARLVQNSSISLPPLPEQRKIATVLKACDTEIDLLTQKLDALQRQKKGLMQRLLTGQVRVKM